jgi:hypothetical protein
LFKLIPFINMNRLSGSPPFWHRRQVIMLRMIMQGRYSFSQQDWDDVSDDSKDLVGFPMKKIIQIYLIILITR